MKPLIPTVELQVYASGFDHAEGICQAPNQKIYVGGEGGQVYEIGDDRIPNVIANTGGFSLGLAADAHNRIYVCDHVNHCVWRMNEDHSLDIFSKGNFSRPMRVPNWGCFDNLGNYYVSDSGNWGECDGLIWKVTNGEAEEWNLQSKNFPNGIALSADCKTLFVLESNPPALIAIPILKDGQAGERRIVVELPGTVPDGVAITDDGRFIIACYRPDAIYVVSQDGSVVILAEDEQGVALAAPTNVAFIGPNLDKMIVPNLGRWHITQFQLEGIRGIPLNYPSRLEIGA